MEIDPIDDGPRVTGKPDVTMTPASATAAPANISEEDEVRQAIDMLRGDDVSARVAAASRLESVASVLGEQRTREVGVGLLWRWFVLKDVVSILTFIFVGADTVLD